MCASQNTSIPIPQVYGSNLGLGPENPVGCPFFLLEYIHGSTAEHMSRAHPGGDREGIPEEFRAKFWAQLASVVLQLAAVRLPKIGSIVRDGAAGGDGGFTVGPLVGTASGPYDSAAEYHAQCPAALSKSLGTGDDGQVTRGQEELVRAFSAVVSSAAGSGAGFGQANYDLEPFNVPVDSEFTVLAVIDWDSVAALPGPALHP